MKINTTFKEKILKDVADRRWHVDEVLNVEDETENEYLLKIRIGYGLKKYREVNVWAPKNCVMTDEEYEKEFENGMTYHQRLVEFAKKNGVKGVRYNLNIDTLMNKIQNAGLEMPAKFWWEE